LENDVWYSGRPYSGDDSDYIQYNNRMIGGIRLRQLRVRNDSCTIPPYFKSVTNFCYNEDYSDSTKDTSPFGPNNKYTYTTAAESGSATLWGYVGGWYEGGGYIVDIPLGSNATQIVDQLVEDEWWDRGTRVIIVSMNFVNVALDGHGSVLYLMMEIPAAGVVSPSFQQKTFRLDLYINGVDVFRGILEIIFVLLLGYLYYSEMREFKELYAKGGAMAYFSSVWNCLDTVTLLAFTVTAIWYVVYLALPVRLSLDLSTTSYLAPLETVASTAVNMYNICAFNILLAAFRLFKFLRLNDRLFVIWKALKVASLEIISFLVMFFIMFLGFLLMGWLTFGPDTAFFNTFGNAFGSCWNFVLGNPPDYTVLTQSNRVLGPLFFTLFTIFVFFIMINMFIAILNDAYDTVHRKSSHIHFRRTVAKKTRRMIHAIKNTFQGKQKLSAKKLIEQMKDISVLDKGEVTLEEMKRALGGGATDEQARELLDVHAKLHNGDYDPAIFGDIPLGTQSSISTLRSRSSRSSQFSRSSRSRRSTTSAVGNQNDDDDEEEDSLREELRSLHEKLDDISKQLKKP